MALLEVKNLTKNFGGLTAVGDVSMELNEGELVGLIGPNGAGKTTLFNLLTGVYEPSEGTVTLDGTVLNGKAPYKIASLGLSRTFQNIRLFKDMTVLENVLVGLSNKQPSNFFASLLRLPKYYSSEEELKAKAKELGIKGYTKMSKEELEELITKSTKLKDYLEKITTNDFSLSYSETEELLELINILELDNKTLFNLILL